MSYVPNLDLSSIRLEKWARLLAWCTGIVAVLAIAFNVAALSAVGSLWDDSFMFIRYAHNILSHGVIAWNGTEPTFGNTSQLQLLITVPLAAIFQNAFVVATLQGLIGLVLFLAAALFLALSSIPLRESLARVVVVAATLAFIALGIPQFALTASTGMDTMLSLAYLCLYLGLLLRVSRSLESASPGSVTALGVLGGIGYLVRPDLMLFTTGVPFALALWSGSSQARARGWRLLTVTFVALAFVLAALWAYYGTPLPLPYFQKTAGILGATPWKRFAFQPILQFIAFVDSYKLLFFIAAAFALWGWRLLFRRGDHAVLIGMYASASVAILYYLFFVLQLMGYNGRFYYPALPVLLALAAVVIGAILRSFADAPRTRAAFALGISFVLLAGLFTPFMWGLQRIGYTAFRQRADIAAKWGGNFADGVGKNDTLVWPCIDVIASLPDTVSVASTETGKSGVLLRDHYFLNIDGLHSNEISLQHMSPGAAIEKHHIDVVYLPSVLYLPELRAGILSSPVFQSGAYDVFPQPAPGGANVAVLKSSPYAAQIEKCLTALFPPGTTDAGSEDPSMWNLPSSQYYYLTLPYPLR